MILYNTMMGFCAALVLLITSNILKLSQGSFERLSSTVHGYGLLVAGVPLTVLSFLMATTWPLKVNLPINILFAEPSLILGMLAITGGTFLVVNSTRRIKINGRVFIWIVAAVGLMLLSCSAAIFRFNVVGDAPSMEPISGQFHGWENTTFGIIYLIAALSCLALPFTVTDGTLIKLVRYGWNTVGVFFLVFSCLNYYTHMGLLTCTTKGVCLPW